MLKIIQHTIVTGICLLAGLTLAQASERIVKFPDQMEYCFTQAVLRGSSDQVTLAYNLLIDEEDYGKEGTVFVGFRLNSKPNQLWLKTTGGKWLLYDLDQRPLIDRLSRRYDGVLTPVIALNILDKPIDLSNFDGDGVIFVGYGLKNPIDFEDNSIEEESSKISNAFWEMLEEERYFKLYSVGSNSLTFASFTSVCLTASGMKIKENAMIYQNIPPLESEDSPSTPAIKISE